MSEIWPKNAYNRLAERDNYSDLSIYSELFNSIGGDRCSDDTKPCAQILHVSKMYFSLSRLSGDRYDKIDMCGGSRLQHGRRPKAKGFLVLFCLAGKKGVKQMAREAS